MNALITGASGFIGSHLTNALLSGQANTNVYTLDRTVREKISPAHHPIPADFSTPFLLPDHLPVPDVVFHLAQSRHYREFPGHAQDIYKVNIETTFHLIDWCKRKGVKRFIYASTGSVYKPSTELLTEVSETEAGNFYAASKLAAENLLRPYGEWTNVSVVRLFSPYGPGQKNMLIPNVIARILGNEEITLNQNTGLYLSPVYIDDCVEILIRLAETEQSKFAIYNLGGSQQTTLREIVNIIGAGTNKSPRVRITEGNVVNISADSSKIYRQSNYHPKFNLTDGLKKCYP
ncbi:MAG TPA: NAD(P)-dependent oxidoreductase [Bacteroidia bacterium]|nr:NAD(P)-dependent oxidoreductase [Bacteroidia bacterium]